MKKIILSLLILALVAVGSAAAADVKLAWDPNAEPEVTGYNLHWSTVNQIPFDNQIDAGSATTATVTDLAVGTTYFFTVTAYDAAGNQSDYSNIVEYTAEAGQVIIRILDRPKGIKVIFD